MVNGIDVRRLFVESPRERFRRGVAERVARGRRARSRESIVFTEQARATARAEAARQATIRTSREFRPQQTVTVKLEKPEVSKVKLLFSKSLSPKVRAIQIFEAGNGLEGARLQRFENLKSELANEKSNIDAKIKALQLQQRNLSQEVADFNFEQRRLQRLARNNLLQEGVAIKNRNKARELNKKIKALNQKSDDLASQTQTFNQGVQAINRTEQRANVVAGKKVSEIKTKAFPTAVLKAAPPKPTVTIKPETFVRPTFAGEILFPDDTRRKVIESRLVSLPEPITRVSRDIETGLQTGLESGLGAGFEFGQTVLGVTPTPVKRVAARVLAKDIEFVRLLTGDLGVAETKKRVVPTAAAVAEIGTIALPGGVGIARRVQAAAAFGDPFDLAVGAATGGVTRLAKSGSQFLKLIGGTGVTGEAIRLGEKAVAKGLFPALIGVQAGVFGFEIAEAKGEPEEIRRIGRETAGGLGAFVLGAQVGGLVGEQLLVPLEAGLARQTALKQLRPGEQKTFEKFFRLAKEIDKVKITPKSFNLATERLTKREAQVVTKFLKENTNVLVFGSASIVPQVPKSIGRTIKPKDIDLSARDFEGVAERIATRLRASGSKRVSLIKKESGTEITIAGKKAIEVKPRERLIANIGTVRGPLEFPFQSFTKTADGVSILKLGPQAKRQAIGGALEQPQLREKDLIRLERIAGILTPEQASALRKAPKVSVIKKAEQEFRALIGDTRGELFPRVTPIERLKFFDEAIITEVRPRGKPSRVGKRRPKGELESLLGFKAETSIFPFPSKLPAKQVGSTLPIADFSRLVGVEPIKPTPSRLPTRREPRPSILPRVPTVQQLLFGPSKLPRPRRVRPVPSRLPRVTPVPPIAPITFDSLLPRPSPPSKLPPVSPLDLLTFDPFKPEKPGVIPLPVLPTFESLTGIREPSKKGFDTFIKRRGKFRKSNRKPLTRASALDFGGSFVDAGVERSFFIKPSKNQRTKPKNIPELSGGFNPFKFRSPKKRSKLPKESFVERSDFAIDSIGELRGITFKGLMALEKRRAVRGIFPTKRRKRKAKKRKR